METFTIIYFSVAMMVSLLAGFAYVWLAGTD